MSKLTWVKWLIYASAAFTLGMLAFIVGFIVWNGLGALTPSLFAWDYTTDNLSLTPAVHCLWLVRDALLRYLPTLPVFALGRDSNHCHYGPAHYYFGDGRRSAPGR